ncbi:hypothetical protein [Streptomyces sp. NPDC000410]|uniref:hypothetical protein n=1 Tax=Streptomyces sp. NPDC000410 TaxID=3154254 RepID=UPI0033347898
MAVAVHGAVVDVHERGDLRGGVPHQEPHHDHLAHRQLGYRLVQADRARALRGELQLTAQRPQVPHDRPVDDVRRVAALPGEALRHVPVRHCKGPALKLVLLEPVLAPFVQALDGVRLEMGIGLQSADMLVRSTLVNARISWRSFERALAVMSAVGIDPKVYLMFEPPFLTDGEAVTDVVESVDYLTGLGVLGVTLCPTRVCTPSVTEKL